MLCRHLSGEWSLNEQYNYGWFVPFFAFYLFWLRWENRPEIGGQVSAVEDQKSEVSNQRSELGSRIAFLLSTFAVLLLLPLRVFEIGNPDWRPLGWIHAVIVVAVTLFFVWRAGGKPWLRHFAFPIAFILVAVPWISPIENPIIQGLMHVIAGMTTETANLLGIPAQLEGNVIHIRNGILGVNEACSGVRSLQTSLMIGLLFGELKRLLGTRRFILVAGAVAIALFANFCRALFLLYVAATNGISASERWHDIAGYAIVGAVFIASLGFAALLARGQVESTKKVEDGSQRSEVRDRSSELGGLRSHFRISNFYFLISFLAWLVAVEIGSDLWYRSHETNLVAHSRWTVRAPATIQDYHEIKIDEGVRQTLGFDSGREFVWKTRVDTSADFSAANYLFFFRWNPSGSSVVRARAHSADICLPDVGWTRVTNFGVKTYNLAQNVSVPVQHILFKREPQNIVAHTFFCLQEDRIHPTEPRPDLHLREGLQPDWSLTARWRVVRNGVRNLGQQVLEIIIVSQKPIDEGAAEMKLAEIIREVVVPL